MKECPASGTPSRRARHPLRRAPSRAGGGTPRAIRRARRRTRRRGQAPASAASSRRGSRPYCAALASKPRFAMRIANAPPRQKPGDADPPRAVVAAGEPGARRGDLGEGSALAGAERAHHRHEAAHRPAVGEQVRGDGVEAEWRRSGRPGSRMSAVSPNASCTTTTPGRRPVGPGTVGGGEVRRQRCRRRGRRCGSRAWRSSRRGRVPMHGYGARAGSRTVLRGTRRENPRPQVEGESKRASSAARGSCRRRVPGHRDTRGRDRAF